MIRTFFGTVTVILVGFSVYLFGPAGEQSTAGLHPKGIPDAAASKRTTSSSLQYPLELAAPGVAVCMTDTRTEDDFPALAMGPGDTIWLAYVEYQPGQPINMQQVRSRVFDSLIPQGHGDRIRLARLAGDTWQSVVDVTDGELDVWRPAVSVDGRGNVVVAWAQNVAGNWEIFCRQYTPPSAADARGIWSETIRVTNAPGADFHVVATTDSAGVVWLAWQGWRAGSFDIHAAALGREVATDGTIDVQRIADTAANEWSPALAADSRGQVYVAWDSYAAGNYDVRVQVLGRDRRTIAVADSARFEARASLICDAADRLWIAYEEGDEQWGKDSSVPLWFRDLGQKDPAFGLYDRRTVRVKCLVDGKLMRTAGRLADAFSDHLQRNKSLPRLAVDAAGGIWLGVRHHPLANGRGEAWHSYVTRYDGQSWSRAQAVPNSSNLLDNRPALAAYGKGILSVHSSDDRTQTRNRQQNDLFAVILDSAEATHPPQFAPLAPPPPAELVAFHPDEAGDLARMREFRLQHGSQNLRLLRGDFHRHTEYTAHRDGDGLLEDSWRYALDAGALDWMGNGDHDLGYGFEYYWWQIQKVTDLVHHPPHFVAAQTYERSVVYPSGHRNVMFPRRGIRALPRISQEQDLLFGTPEAGSPDIKLLYDFLRHFGGICASHTSGTGMGTDWRDNDPELEPIVEIFQGCRQMHQNYEHLGAPRAAPRSEQPGKFDDGYVWNALAKGHRLGFQSSSDHFSTHISYAIVLAENNSRQAIIDAFKKRRCYAANDNIVLIVRSGEHLMGEEFETRQRPSLQILVQGTRPISRVHVIRDNQYVYTTEPDERQLRLSYTDTAAAPGEAHYYYVRVEQQDGSLAWASPMWIRYAN